MHPGFGMRCGKECEDKMSEITKAFMLCGCMEVEKGIAKLKSLRVRSQNLQSNFSETTKLKLIHIFIIS